MRVQWLRAMRAIVDSGTVTEAAQRLCVTQPAVSRMIANLQKELGFDMFVREGGRLRVTPQGQAFYAEIVRVLDGLDDITGLAEQIRSGSASRLRLLTMSPLANELLPAAVSRLLNEFPTLNVSIEIRGRRDVSQWMSGHQFDLGVVLLPVDDVVSSVQPFARAPVYAILPRGHQYADRAEISLDDLVSDRLVLLPRHSLMRRWVDGKFSEIGRVPNVAIETSSMLSAGRLVAAGVGVSIVDAFTVKSLARDDVVALPVAPGLHVTFGFIHPPDRVSSPLVHRLEAIVSEVAAGILGP